jgi:hypothetical protein
MAPQKKKGLIVTYWSNITYILVVEERMMGNLTPRNTESIRRIVLKAVDLISVQFRSWWLIWRL